MEYQQVSSATTFSKKLPKGAGKHVYDGVFGASVESVLRGKDYRDIFIGSGTCSIPMLDVPELNEKKLKVDARRSKLDYSKIFGGFGDADFAVPCEILFTKPKNGSSSQAEVGAAPDELTAYPPAPENFKFSEEKKSTLPGIPCQSSNTMKQFKELCNKTKPGSPNGSNAVPDFTCLIDEVTQLQMTEGGGTVCSVLNNAHLSINVNEVIKEGKPQNKHVSGPQPRLAPENSYGIHAEYRKRPSRHRSISNDKSSDAFEFGLDGHSQSMPSTSSQAPNLFNDKGNSNITVNSKFEVPRSDVSEGAAGNYSPPSFYDEVNANSVAALSAAAVRQAIEEAQAKIRIAKEIMERKREGLQQSVKQKLNNGLKTERNEVKTAGRANIYEEKEAQEICEKINIPKQVCTGLSEHNAAKATQVTLEFRGSTKSSVANNAVRETHSMESKSTQAEHRLEKAEDGKTADELFYAVDTSLEQRATKLDFEQEGDARKIQSCPNETEQTEKLKMELNIKKPKDNVEKSKAFEEAPKQQKIERELNLAKGTFEWNPFLNDIKSAHELHHLEENEEKTRVAHEHEEAEQTSQVSFDRGKCESMMNKLQAAEEVAEIEFLDLEKSKYMELQDARGWGEIEKKQREALFQEEMENRSDEVPGREETERRHTGIFGQEENGKGNKEAWERSECKKKQEQSWKQEENKKHQNDILMGSEIVSNLREVHEEEAIKVSSNDLQENEERAEGIEKLDKAKEKKDCWENEAFKKLVENFEQMGVDREYSDIHQLAEGEKNMEVTQQTSLYQGNNLEEAGNVCKQGESEKLGMTNEACGPEEKIDGVDVTAEMLIVEENGRIMEVNEVSFEPKWTGEGAKAVEEANDQKEEKNPEVGGIVQDFTGYDKIKKEVMDASEDPDVGKNEAPFGETDLEYEHKQNEHHVTEYMRASDQEKQVEERTFEAVSESEIGTNNEYNQDSFVASHKERLLDSGVGSHMHYDLEKHVGEVACESVEGDKDATGAEYTNNHEGHENAFESSNEDRQLDHGLDVGASQQPFDFEEKEKTAEISKAQNTSQSFDKKEENHHKPLKMKENEGENTWQKEVEVEQNLHPKNEEAKESEIAKEKERIAFEQAIREAQERAFAEARERAERAAAEAQQGVEARARPDKASTEINNKLAEGKVSVEAKLKAEHAAVDRATSEARKRALEKASSETEKAASKQVQDNEGPDHSSSSKYPSSSNEGVPCSTERSTGANDELVQRFKATSERDQRMAERAAKALAEKNTRDLLAQKEQAERNRLAETLDAEVKRWSSGKERNLRALLSTLQYILGPDSGWQPIPLTDLIPTTAVKKAYRKATLFVHPDKLQQRGASRQQKYICEKVFDLLKEAWNKFEEK